MSHSIVRHLFLIEKDHLIGCAIMHPARIPTPQSQMSNDCRRRQKFVDHCHTVSNPAIGILSSNFHCHIATANNHMITRYKTRHQKAFEMKYHGKQRQQYEKRVCGSE
jgi:hypothetical protein